MKPTWSRISRYGLFPFAPSLDHVGFFSRSIDDSAIILSCLSGRDEMDSTSSTKPVENYADCHLPSLKGKKIAVLREIIDSISDKTLLSKFSSSLDKMKEDGAEICYIDFGLELLQSVYPTYIVISCAEATSNDANLDGIKFGPYYGGSSYQEVMFKARTKGFSELIKRRFVIGSFALMKENQEDLFLRAQRNRAKLVERTNQILGDHDVIYVPAAPSIAPYLGGASNKLSNEYLIADNHLALGNFSGLPSVTLPLGLENGFPLGVNFMGRAFEEKELYGIAERFEELSGLGGLAVNNMKEGNL